jgi:hypothetical protein
MALVFVYLLTICYQTDVESTNTKLEKVKESEKIAASPGYLAYPSLSVVSRPEMAGNLV